MKMKMKIRKRKRNDYSKDNRIATLCTLLLVEFLLFPTVPLLVKMVMPIRTFVTVYLVVIFAVDVLE